MADGPDMMSMLPMLISMATAGQNGQGAGGYMPSHSPAGLNFGNNMGSLSGALGGSLGTMGPFADMFGMMFAPDLMQKLQNGAGVDQMALQRQRQMQRQMMQYATSVPGSTVIAGLGMDPNSGAGQAAAKALPFISMFAPELSSSIYSAISPNYMSMTGAQRLIGASAIQDNHGRVEPGMLESMVGSLDRLGKTEKGFRDDRFMHGFNRDSFAGFVQFAADQGEIDMDMDRPAARKAARERYRAKNLGGRGDDVLSSEERDDMEASAQRDVESEGLVRSASIHAKIGRQIKRMAPGISDAEAMDFMNQGGLVASNASEGDAITELLRKLEALGNATGTTTQQLINAGRTLQSQNGGSLLYQMQVAGTARMAERLGTEFARENKANTTPGGDQAGTARATDALSRFANSGFANIDAAIALEGSEADKREWMEAKKKGPGAMRDKALEVERGSTAFGKKFQGINVSAADREVASKGITMDEEANGINSVGLRAGVMEEEALARSGGASSTLGKLRAKLGNDRFNSLLALKNIDANSDDIKKSLGMSDQDMAEWVKARKMLSPQQLDDLRGTGAAVQASKAVDVRTKDDAAMRKATEELGEALSAQQGAGQGIVPNIRAANISSFADVLTSMGYKTPDNMARLTAGVTDEQRKNFVTAGRKRARAMEIIDDPNSTDAAREKAHKALEDASGVLASFNVAEQSDAVKKAMGIAPAEKKDDILDGPAAGGSKAPGSGPLPATSVMPGGTAGVRSGAADGKQNAKLEIDLKLNGQKLDHTDFDLKAAAVQGYREVVVNGQQVGASK